MTPGTVTTLRTGEGAVQERVRALTGLVFPGNRLSALQAGVERGMRRAGIGDVDAYLTRLAVESALLDDLVAEVTVGETYFFRDAPQCRVIRERILPELLGSRPGRPLRIWSAGCATGEEPWTLSILHAETGAPEPARILGTDLSRPALARASRARYGRWALRGLTPEDVARYFRASHCGFALRRDLMGDVEFRYLNLVEDTYPSLASGISGMDLILCRNVLIYFDARTAEQVVRRLMASLAPGGWLLLGASDPSPPDPGPCEVVVTESGLAYVRTDTPEPPRHGPFIGRDPVRELSAPSGASDGGLRLPPPPHASRGAPPAPAGRPVTAAPVERGTHALLSPPSGVGEAVARVRQLANAGDLQAAGRACAAALDAYRTSAELTYLHGVLLVEAGQYVDAAAAFRACLYLDRNMAVGHLALGGAFCRLGDAAGARRCLQAAERILASQSPDAAVPAADGERAGRLLAAARAQFALLPPEVS